MLNDYRQHAKKACLATCVDLLEAGMDLRKLAYFLEVAERQNVTSAARHLGISQPALSRQVKSFEEEMGSELFTRKAKEVILTREGRIVQREGKRVLRMVEAARERLRRELKGGELRVGFAPSLSVGLVETAIAVFSQIHPAIRVILHDGNTGEMMAMVKDDRLDLMVEVAGDEPEFRWEVLREREFVLALPSKHPLAKKRKVRARDLDGERLLLFSRLDYPRYWRDVSAYFASHGLNAKVAGEFDGIESLRMGLDAGLGVAFVAEDSRLGGSIVIRRLDPRPSAIRVGVGWLASRPLRAWEEVFLAELRRAAGS